MQCAAFRPDRSEQSGWYRCAKRAAQSRFCVEHTLAIQGVMLGLAVFGGPDDPQLTPAERVYGREYLNAVKGNQVREEKKKALAKAAL
jgi:hypothetical protein